MIPVVKIPFPGSMVTVIFGIVLLASAQDLKNSIEIVGYIPPGLPQGRFPITSIAIQNFSSLATSFLVMALLAFLEMITVGKIYSAKNGYTVDPNGELIAAGLANIVGSFFGCFPVTGGFARTPVNAQAGAKTQMTGIVCSLVVAIVLLALTNVFAYLPKAILASIIFVAVLALFDTDQAFYLWKVNKAEWTLMLVTFLVTLGIGPQFGIFISIGLSLSLVLFRSSRPGFAILGRVVGTDVYRSIIDYPEAVCIPGIICFQFQSPVYFMNAAYMRKSLIDAELLLSKNTPTEAIIIDAQAITYIDSVGLTSFDEIIKYFHERNIVISIANLTGRAELALRRSGLVDRIGEDNLFLRLHDAIRASLANRLIIPPPPDIDPLAVDYTNRYLEQTLSKVKDKLKETFSIPIPDRDKPKDNNPPTDDIPVTLEETQQENTGNVNPLFAGQIQSSKTSPGNKSKNSSGWMVNMGQGSSQSSTTDSSSDSSSSDIKLSTEEKSESSD
jgi:MFS superfamily sulfate permease-like transporter